MQTGPNSFHWFISSSELEFRWPTLPSIGPLPLHQMSYSHPRGRQSTGDSFEVATVDGSYRGSYLKLGRDSTRGIVKYNYVKFGKHNTKLINTSWLAGTVSYRTPRPLVHTAQGVIGVNVFSSTHTTDCVGLSPAVYTAGERERVYRLRLSVPLVIVTAYKAGLHIPPFSLKITQHRIFKKKYGKSNREPPHCSWEKKTIFFLQFIYE
ncbi:hypothetical protein EVAR_17762_1 [Eumeta japonica]|uniref:Uncharacterized protein n=1 Tax=Eumeta variegata TaxID=151549 RepID=A0A4C1TTD0_EUMVA|nr:hypothetical protein EVAR_17762_1 [Eumeta japonica]